MDDRIDNADVDQMDFQQPEREPGHACMLDEARDLVGFARIALPGDRSFLSDPDFAQAVLVLQREDRNEWNLFRAFLTEHGILGELERSLRKHGHSSAGVRTAGSMLRDAPVPDLHIPAGFEIGTDRTVSVEQNREGKLWRVPIASAPILVTGRLRDPESGKELLRLSWRRSSEWRHQIVDRAAAMQARRVVELASFGFPVSSNNAAALVRYIEAVEAENYGRLPVVSVTTRMGWRPNENGFLWGRAFLPPAGETARSVSLSCGDWIDGDVAFKGLTAEDERIADGYHSCGTLTSWSEAVAVLRDYPKPLLALYASFVSPMLSIVGAPNFIVDFSHRTSTGKTTALRAAASVWGRPNESAPDRVLSSWDTTLTGAERLAALISGMPLILDDTKRAREGLIAKLIYQVAHGLGATRGSETSLARTLSWRTVLISTGEQPITSFTKDGGTRTRCLVVLGLPFGAQDQRTGQVVDHLIQRLQRNYGHAGPMFVRWLQENRAEWDSFRQEYERRKRAYAERSQAPEGNRLAQYAAAIDLTAYLVHRALPLPWSYTDPFSALWEEIVSEAADAGGELAALRDVVSWARAHSEQFYRPGLRPGEAAPSEGWLGRWETHYLGVHSQTLKALLQDIGYDSSPILSGWRERGWLECQSGRLTKQVRLGTANPQMFVIRAKAIELAEQDGPPR